MNKHKINKIEKEDTNNVGKHELRKDSIKVCEQNDKLSLRMKRNYAKSGCDELVEKIKIKIKQRRIFSVLRESIREEHIDAEDTDEEISSKSEFDVRKKESEEELKLKEVEKEL